MEVPPKTILVVGGTGATGRLLVRSLLDRGQDVRLIVRSPERVPEDVRDDGRATIISGTVLEMDDATLAGHVVGCDGVASCLGHQMTLRGILGPPWRLVAGSVLRLCRAIQVNRTTAPVRFVLMNSTGCRNRDLPERVSIAQRVVVRGIRTVVPPHADNEAAAEFLRSRIGQSNPAVEWAVVRPDTLIDADRITPYDIHPSPTRSAIFDAGRTSRINVADWMAELLTTGSAWSQWVGRMPVIYNQED